MTIDDRVDTGTAADSDYQAAAADLVVSLARNPWGQVSPSVYETARLVALAPWLTGHSERLAYLLENQRPDGGWGGPGGYALVPTLSATDAMLSVLRRPSASADHGAAARSAGSALPMLARLLASLDEESIPDTPAVDLIVASLTDSIDEHLRALRGASHPRLGDGSHVALPGLPPGLDRSRLKAVTGALEAGMTLPEKVFHALEVAGPAASRAAGAPPTPTGTIGASPAATAAWLGPEDAHGPDHAARRFLEKVVRDHGGPVPCGIPITLFERSWVIGTLLRAGLAPAVPAALVADFTAGLGPDGAPGAAGLPADADTTAVVLYSLSHLGVKMSPDVLLRYETETHFCTWPGEGGHSTSVNAHVLDAFGQYLKDSGQFRAADESGSVRRFTGIVRKVSSWLCDQQHSDGSWHDRWHVSPYYATACCALALSDFGVGEARAAVSRAVDWVVQNQRPDGSWGLWEGTAEETAYALHVLSLARSESRHAIERAVADGREHLRRAALLPHRPALWHDKDLYLPTVVVEAEIVAALHLTRSAPRRSGPPIRPPRKASQSRQMGHNACC